MISFLWDDLASLANRAAGPSPLPSTPTPAEAVPVPLEEYASCRLCPKQCGLNRLERSHPTCGNFELRVASSGISFGDEPAIRGSGIIMLSGCPLRCPSCHNPEMVAMGTPTSVAELIALVHDLAARGAHNIQLLSPTVHLPALRVALRHLKKSGFPLPIVLKSSGYERVEELRKLEGLVDIYLPDFKFGGCSAWGARAGVKNYFSIAKSAIHEMIRQVGALELDERGHARRGVLVRHVLAPLPATERAEILDFFEGLPQGVATSVLDTFQMLE